MLKTPALPAAIADAAESGAFEPRQLAHLKNIIAAVMKDEQFKPAWFTVSGLARHWQQTEGTIRRRIRDKEIAAKKIGDEWRVPRQEVERLEAEAVTNQN